jgi:Zn finger protein HypA/HybF involved in hydrogenase expression
MKKDKIIALLNEGKSVSYIVKTLKCSAGTVSYHRQHLNMSYDDNKRKPLSDFDWEEIQRFYDSGRSLTDCQSEFGISRANMIEARTNGLLKVVKKSYDLDEVFVENSPYPRGCVKRRIIKECILDYKCACCGIGDEWNNEKLVLHLDHINGTNNDHRLENLRFLCPNCHSQQDTYAGKNKTNIDRKPKSNYRSVAQR